MKRFISIIFTVIILSSCVCIAFASEDLNAKVRVYDENGNEYLIRPDEVLGIVKDADGNIVSQTIVPYATYVDGTIYSIPSGGTFTSYQYVATDNFAAGFYFVKNNKQVTDAGKSVYITIQNASQVGGTKATIKSRSFSTTEADNAGINEYYFEAVNGGSGVQLVTQNLNTSRPYHSAVYKNTSSSALSIAILISKD